MASTVPNINIDQHSNLNIDNVNLTLVRSEQDITNAIHFNTTILPNVAKNMESIRAWAGEQMSSGEVSRSKAIFEVVKVLQKSVSSIQALTSDHLADVMKGCLNIAGTIATVVGGPYSGIQSTICVSWDRFCQSKLPTTRIWPRRSSERST